MTEKERVFKLNTIKVEGFNNGSELSSDSEMAKIQAFQTKLWSLDPLNARGVGTSILLVWIPGHKGHRKPWVGTAYLENRKTVVGQACGTNVRPWIRWKWRNTSHLVMTEPTYSGQEIITRVYTLVQHSVRGNLSLIWQIPYLTVSGRKALKISDFAKIITIGCIGCTKT